MFVPLFETRFPLHSLLEADGEDFKILVKVKVNLWKRTYTVDFLLTQSTISVNIRIRKLHFLKEITELY